MAIKPQATEQLQAKARELKTSLSALGDMFPGSLLQRFRKCGKSNCHCAKKDSPGHGPTWVITREVAGRTITTTIPEEAVERVRIETEEYKQFRQLSHELVETSAQLSEIRLQKTGSGEAVKKNRARRQPGR